FSATPTAVRTGPALPGAGAESVARDWDLPREQDPPRASLPNPAVHNPQ
ncbi:CoA transferase, partial [Streptomyces sp. ICN988]|nr:CoA transferase [Streptomyces sp. ICN988]